MGTDRREMGSGREDVVLDVLEPAADPKVGSGILGGIIEPATSSSTDVPGLSEVIVPCREGDGGLGIFGFVGAIHYGSRARIDFVK